MRFFNFITITTILAGVTSALPVEEIYGDVIETGLTEEGLPYTITSVGTRRLTEAEISEWNALNTANSTGLERRTGEGSGGNCDQWYSNRYCYCSGAMSNRGDSYWGSQDHCDYVAEDRGKDGVWGRTESHTIKWLPTVKIEYKITNFCDHRYTVQFHDCGRHFLYLIDWCQWTWQGAKGGLYRDSDCIQYYFDVNGR